PVGQVVGIIAEGGIAIHHPILIEPCGPEAEPPFKIILDPQHDGRHMPVVTCIILKSSTVPCATGKASRLVAQWIRLGSERAQGAVAHGYTVGITTEFGSRCGILQVVLPIMLG